MPHALNDPQHPGYILIKLTQKLENLHESMEFQLTNPSSDQTLVAVYESTCVELYELLRDKYHIEEAFFEYSLFDEEFQPILAAAVQAQNKGFDLLARYWTPERSAEWFEGECETLTKEEF